MAALEVTFNKRILIHIRSLLRQQQSPALGRRAKLSAQKCSWCEQLLPPPVVVL